MKNKIKNMYRSKSNTDIEAVIKNLPTKKNPVSHDSTCELYQILKNINKGNLSQTFPKCCRGRNTSRLIS